jgi:hypothetical protein
LQATERDSPAVTADARAQRSSTLILPLFRTAAARAAHQQLIVNRARVDKLDFPDQSVPCIGEWNRCEREACVQQSIDDAEQPGAERTEVSEERRRGCVNASTVEFMLKRLNGSNGIESSDEDWLCRINAGEVKFEADENALATR